MGLSPRAAALLQQREREGTSEDGIGRDWAKSKKRKLELSPRSLDQLNTLVAGSVQLDGIEQAGASLGNGVEGDQGGEAQRTAVGRAQPRELHREDREALRQERVCSQDSCGEAENGDARQVRAAKFDFTYDTVAIKYQ